MTTTSDPREGDIQRMIVILLRTLGWTVYSLSQGYRKEKGGTRMSPGIPDLYAFHKAKGLTLWVEVKTPKELARLDKLLTRVDIPRSYVRDYRRALAQAAFGELCRAVGQPYVRGGTEEVVGVLRSLGFKVGAA